MTASSGDDAAVRGLRGLPQHSPGKAKRLELRLREQGTVGVHRRAHMGRKATLLGNQGAEAGMGRALDGR